MNINRARRQFYRFDQYDNDGVFRDMILRAVTPEARVLDAGAGAGDLFRYNFKGRVAQMVGVDLDSRVLTNPQLDHGIAADLTAIPVESGSFDVVFSRYVVEHVADPSQFLCEMGRILAPGGQLLLLTPNRWHYVALGSRLLPHGFHTWFNNRRGRAEEDTFPTYYRMNSVGTLRRLGREAGFREQFIELRECCPNYLTFAWPAFLAGVAYERLVNSHRLLAGLRVNILGCFRKEPEPEG